MQGKRLYMFHQAYEDYFSRIQDLVKWFFERSKAIWQWFWKGKGADVFEIILRVCVVLSGITLGVMYVIYEKKCGSALSFQTFLACLFIIGFVSLLMWGWKAPLHLFTRVASGLTASCAVLMLSLSLSSAAFIVFSFYFVILFILTAFSVIIFLPVRTAEEIWLLYRKINYTCPHDDCSFTGLPIHLCPKCETPYPDLLPNFYGIFNHICYHEETNEKVKLPTLNILGRSKLERLCGNCKRPLIFSSIGELAANPIAIIGGPSTGKTVFLTQALKELENYFTNVPNAEVKLDSDEQVELIERNVDLLGKGQRLDKTVGDVCQAFGLAVRTPQYKHLLYLFDAPGEDFARMERFARKQMIENISGIILLADPFSFPELSENAHYFSDNIAISETPFYDIVAVALSGVTQLKMNRKTNKCDIPVAVVLNKVDALPAVDNPFLADLFPNEILLPNKDQKMSDLYNLKCRNVMEELGEGRSVRVLEQRFSQVRYFACSALGRTPDDKYKSPFVSGGVMNPLAWLLKLPEVK